ncbi:Phosphoethanolamine transferase-like protein [Candidatus Hepatincolaceae symbiont of Richtersius coronifer]
MVHRLLKGPFYFFRIRFILYFSIFAIIFYNWPSLGYKFNINKDFSLIKGTLLIFSEYLLGIVILFIFLFIFSFSKTLLKLWCAFFIIFSSINSYYVFSYNIFLDELLLGAILEANSNEAMGVIDYKLFIWILFIGIIPLYLLLFKVRFINNIRQSLGQRTLVFIKQCSILFMIIAVTVATIYVINPKLSNKRLVLSSLSIYLPFNYVAALYQHFAVIKKSQYTNLIDIVKIAPFNFKDSSLNNEDINIILVIGESARADRQSLNGYIRETNPNLSKIDNLISFSKVTSCATLSRVSVNCLLSHKTAQDFELPVTHTNLIAAFKSLGFSTHFLSTQTMYEKNSNNFLVAAKEADEIVFANTIKTIMPSGVSIYDEHIFPFIDKLLKKPKTNLPHKRLIVMYLLGSHLPYETRYPDKFRIFPPDTSNYLINLNNRYDNSILYTDYFLSELIKKFENSKTFLYYVADHGESLGENDVFFHGSPLSIAPKEQLNVAQFIWFSKSLIKFMPKQYDLIRAKKDDPINHDYVFNTLFDCFNITSELVNTNLSLCQSEVVTK